MEADFINIRAAENRRCFTSTRNLACRCDGAVVARTKLHREVSHLSLHGLDDRAVRCAPTGVVKECPILAKCGEGRAKLLGFQHAPQPTGSRCDRAQIGCYSLPVEIKTWAEVVVDADIERVFDYATDPAKVPSLFTGFGPIPAILRMEVQGDGVQRTGGRRTIHNSDGTALEEDLVEFERPRAQAYRLHGQFVGVTRFILREGSGRWTFESVAGSSRPATRVRWDYAFVLVSPLALPVALPLAKLAFRAAQRRCLDNLKRAFR